MPPSIRFHSECSATNHSRIWLTTEPTSIGRLCPLWLRSSRISEHNSRHEPKNTGNNAGETFHGTLASKWISRLCWNKKTVKSSSKMAEKKSPELPGRIEDRTTIILCEIITGPTRCRPGIQNTRVWGFWIFPVKSWRFPYQTKSSKRQMPNYPVSSVILLARNQPGRHLYLWRISSSFHFALLS